MHLVPEKVVLCRTGSLVLLLLLQGTLHTALVAAEANLEALSPPCPAQQLHMVQPSTFSRHYQPAADLAAGSHKMSRWSGTLRPICSTL